MYDSTKPTKKKVLQLIKSTWKTPYLSIKENTYSIFKKKFNYYEVDHTDGIGTKGIYHWQKRTFKNAVLDALAMNLNDLAIVRAVPYKLQNHIVLPKDDNEAVLEIISALVKECKKYKIAITGGETSIHDTSDGLDIGITCSGFIKKPAKNKFRRNDVLIGLASSGLHSNGITKVREVFKDQFRNEFIEPTRIYLNDILEIADKYPVGGMMHITGGGFTKLKDLLDGTDAIITRGHTLAPQKIFFELYNSGISDGEMYKTFNCGIGFVLSIPKSKVSAVLKEINGQVIGEIITGTGKVKIQSKFSNKEVTY
ncbi:MAG: AIR synthase-related protein [bacterium]|nr:AIR synthase-related protein [bacterium]